MSNVLVSEDFLKDTYRLIALLDGQIDDPVVEAIRVKIESEIVKKLESKNRRQMFTNYKTAAHGSAKRETSRRQYLDDAGVHPDWRSSEELKPHRKHER